MPVQIVPDEGESVRPNEKSEKSSEVTYHKKYDNTDTSYYDRVLNAIKQLYTLYNPTMKKTSKPVI